jgi:hypothetical protein
MASSSLDRSSTERSFRPARTAAAARGSVENDATLRLAISRRGVLRQQDVAASACGAGIARIARIQASGWPRIVLRTGVLYPGLYKEERGPTWTSDDGGATFRQSDTCHV